MQGMQRMQAGEAGGHRDITGNHRVVRRIGHVAVLHARAKDSRAQTRPILGESPRNQHGGNETGNCSHRLPTLPAPKGPYTPPASYAYLVDLDVVDEVARGVRHGGQLGRAPPLVVDAEAEGVAPERQVDDRRKVVLAVCGACDGQCAFGVSTGRSGDGRPRRSMRRRTTNATFWSAGCGSSR